MRHSSVHHNIVNGGVVVAKRLILRIGIFCAVISLGGMIFRSGEPPVAAKLVTVSRHDVHQVKAITGCLAYAEEQYVFAAAAGTIDKIYVKPGDRISPEQVLLRFVDNESAEQLVNTMAEGEGNTIYSRQIANTVRCEKLASVRDVLVKEGSPVVIGTPLFRISSQEQLISCNVASDDASGISPGQWAWIYAGEVLLGTAEVLSVSMNKTEYSVLLRPAMHIGRPEGTHIDVKIYLAGSDDVLALPIEAVTSRDTVWWINEGRCTEIPAQIVLCNEKHAWVNLPEGLTVAVGEFQEGQKVVAADS